MAALTLRDIVAKLGGEAVGEVRSALTGVATLDSAGPVIVGGMVFTNSGYGMWQGLPGNVLLAFGK